MPYLTFPPAAAEGLARLDRQSQLHASAFLASAARFLEKHTVVPFDGCITAGNCPPAIAAPPRRSGAAVSTPLCLLCAVDFAVARLSNGFNEAVVREFFAVGTVTKQAAILVIEANPGAEADPEVVCVTLSSRLHNRDLTARTAEELAEDADRLACLRAIRRTGLGGRLVDVPQRLLPSLELRGWAAGGYVTPAGRFAVEQQARDERAFGPRSRTRGANLG